MIVHLFAGQTNYSHAWLSMFSGHFNIEGHWFIFGLGKKPYRDFVYDEPARKRILYARNLKSLLFRIIPLLLRAKWIYFHSLAYDPSLLFWAFNRRLLKRSTWIIWGFDLYAFQKEGNSPRTRLYEYLRRRIIPHFPEIASYVEEDTLLARAKYQSQAGYVQILYPTLVDVSLLKYEESRGGPVNILIGNSADPANCHREIIDLLSGFADREIAVICPLSYGGSREYVKEITSLGKEVFGDRFIPLLSVLEPEAYAEILNRTDVCLMNHRRQQGLGNILSLLYLGKKVYLRKETSSFTFFRRNNCEVFDIEDIGTISFDEFRRPPAGSESTRKYAAEIMSAEYYVNLWSNLINRHPS